MTPKITLEQWRALVAVVEAGSFAAAAERLNKSQSTVTYALKRIATLTGLEVFQPGRRVVLSERGQVLYRRGKSLLAEADRLERVARAMAGGQEFSLRLAVETIFPTWLLLETLHGFGEEFPDVRIELFESVLGGTEELLIEGRVDLAVGSRIPPGFSGNALMPVRFVCCAAPGHPLHALGRALSLDDLKRHRHLVVRDSGTQRSRKVLALDAEQRWTLSHKATSIRAAAMGLGFAWFAESNIRVELDRGELLPLPLAEGQIRYATLYLMHADEDAAGPGQRRFGQLLAAAVERFRTKTMNCHETARKVQ